METRREFAPYRFHTTHYEKARLIAERAAQIAEGVGEKCKLTEDEMKRLNFQPLALAEAEFIARKLPLTVVRILPQGEKIVIPADKFVS